MAKQKLPKLMFVHVPKTGGGTFRILLFSKYADKAKSHIVGGHNRFDMYTDLPRVTWTRDPVERVISHYYFWQQYFKNHPHEAARRTTVPAGYPPKSMARFFKLSRPEFKNNTRLKEFVINKPTDCSLLDFAKVFTNIMTLYLGDDLSNYEFIGITEHYKTSLKIFDASFGMDIHDIYENGKKWRKNYNPKKPAVNEEDKQFIASLNELDIKLYQRTLEKHTKDRTILQREWIS